MGASNHPAIWECVQQPGGGTRVAADQGRSAAWITYCTASPRSPMPLRFPSDRHRRAYNVKLRIPVKPELGWNHTFSSQAIVTTSDECREAQVRTLDPQVLGSDPRGRTSRYLFRLILDDPVPGAPLRSSGRCSTSFRVVPGLVRDHLGVMPHDPVQRSPGGSTATSVPELRASGGQVIGSTARDVRRSSGSRVSPV